MKPSDESWLRVNWIVAMLIAVIVAEAGLGAMLGGGLLPEAGFRLGSTVVAVASLLWAKWNRRLDRARR